VGQLSDAMLNPRIRVHRGFILFDTSSIPDANEITQVNIKLTPTNDQSATDFDVDIVKYDWEENDDFSNASQREEAYDDALEADADDNIWRNTNGISTNTTYTSGNLDTDWVDKESTTYYALLSNRDRDGSGQTPNMNEYIEVASQNNATSGYRPVLVVTHEAGGIATRKALLGVGI
jgi:hypothetical protein